MKIMKKELVAITCLLAVFTIIGAISNGNRKDESKTKETAVVSNVPNENTVEALCQDAKNFPHNVDIIYGVMDYTQSKFYEESEAKSGKKYAFLRWNAKDEENGSKITVGCYVAMDTEPSVLYIYANYVDGDRTFSGGLQKYYDYIGYSE